MDDFFNPTYPNGNNNNFNMNNSMNNINMNLMDSPVDVEATLNSLLETNPAETYDFSASLLNSGESIPIQPLLSVSSSSSSLSPLESPTASQTVSPVYFNTTTTTTTTTTSNVPFGSFSINDTKKKRRRRDDILPDEICKGFDWVKYNSVNPSYAIIDSLSMMPLAGDDVDVTVYKSGTNTHFSPADKAWICYRQNQFKVYCYLKMPQGSPLFVRDGATDQEIRQFFVRLHAIKSTDVGLNEDGQVGLYHAGKSRVKKEKTHISPAPFVDGKVEFTNLQFERSNAAKGQAEYFHLAITLFAKTNSNNYPVLHKISPRVIVRSQHPGFYSNNSPTEAEPNVNTSKTASNYTSSEDGTSPKTMDNDQIWQQTGADSISHMGKVGINTSDPTESLTVHGNALITGNLYKPSDRRIKSDFNKVATTEQLDHIRRLQIYDYKIKGRAERGVIAQELQVVHPSAVHEAGDVKINDVTIPNLLVVNERSLLYENIGATQQLDKELKVEKTNIVNIDTRVDNLADATEKSSAELKGQIKSLSDMLFAEDIDEMGEGWKEEQVTFGVNLFRMGPARTFMVLGFFLGWLWLVGALYNFSNIPSRKILGRACTVKFTVWYIMHYVANMDRNGLLIYRWVTLAVGMSLLLENYRRNKRRMQLRREGKKEDIKPATTFMERVFSGVRRRRSDEADVRTSLKANPV